MESLRRGRSASGEGAVGERETATEVCLGFEGMEIAEVMAINAVEATGKDKEGAHKFPFRMRIF
jgi:hypothetical protein